MNKRTHSTGPAAGPATIDKPEEGKVYALTGAKGTACIANGNTWKESEVKDDNN